MRGAFCFPPARDDAFFNSPHGRMYKKKDMINYPKTKKAQRLLADRVCDMGRLGYSRTQIASELDMAIEQIDLWESQFAIFAEGFRQLGSGKSANE